MTRTSASSCFALFKNGSYTSATVDNLRKRLSVCATCIEGASAGLPSSLCSRPVDKNRPFFIPGIVRGEIPLSVNSKRLKYLGASNAGNSSSFIKLPRSIPTRFKSNVGTDCLFKPCCKSGMKITGHWYCSAKLKAC